jgi:hypothetical protein
MGDFCGILTLADGQASPPFARKGGEWGCDSPLRAGKNATLVSYHPPAGDERVRSAKDQHSLLRTKRFFL